MPILSEAQAMKETLVKHRRYIHENAEQHLDLPKTVAYVEEQLRAMGYAPQRLGSSGIVALAGGKKPGKVFLLRADMDALPIQEDSGEPFSCTSGSMHACGHDFHTTMLLGAAKLLKDHEDEIEGTVKLMFQPAEETMSGAKMMVENGVLDNPKVDAAMMIHVTGAIPLPTGTIVVPDPKNSPAACDWFQIDITGKGCHGAMPNNGFDPLNAMAHIHLALQAINAREVSPGDVLVITPGQMHGGATSNVIPDKAMMSGTIRTQSNEVREFVKQRVVEISKGIAESFRTTAEVTFERGCPCFDASAQLVGELAGYAREMTGGEGVWDSATVENAPRSMASEDFSYISLEVPSAGFSVSTGSPQEGYALPVHHPQVRFNEDALPVGAALYANSALEWLKHNSQA